MAKLVRDETGRVIFTEEMRKEYTILLPQMLPIHFEMLEHIFRRHGYNTVLLKTTHPQIVTEGLQDVHNDTCYPALLVIGQMIDALKSGKYDLNKTALMITQTGGGCRASNYIHLLRKALERNGMSHVPVVSLNVSGMEKNPGFVLNLPLIYELLSACFYGDVLMDIANQTRPYELHSGDTDRLVGRWVEKLTGFKSLGLRGFSRAVREICRDFCNIPVLRETKIKVGIVGEIYVKFAPLGNNELEKFLQSEGVEVIVPGLMGFLQFMCDHYVVDMKVYGIKKLKGTMFGLFANFMESMEKRIIKVMKDFPDLRVPELFKEKKKLIDGYVSDRNKMGEGWLLTAEMLELIHLGVPNIICAQPFGCLPNHIVGKGMIRAIRKRHPEANILSVDYDPGATRVNQENRIKLMLSAAKAVNDTRENIKISLQNAIVLPS
ncbi:2-hydroxyglutaryl-CoA dehydratase [Clostridia bacterium]|nr:2-hydroxyglutaryl-CoA dehydratase [Clostridia bacterium]